MLHALKILLWGKYSKSKQKKSQRSWHKDVYGYAMYEGEKQNNPNGPNRGKTIRAVKKICKYNYTYIIV